MKQHNLQRTHGIVLRAVAYGDYDKILTVFTENEGLLSFIAKGALKPNKRGALPAAPLLEAEFLFTPKSGGQLLPCSEITPKNHRLYLREDLDKLDAACKMALAIAASQLPNNPAPALYALLRYFLTKLKDCTRPMNLLSSFRLKIMRHEGILASTPRCSACDEELDAFHAYRDGFYCGGHAPPAAVLFTPEDKALITLLAWGRNYREIEACAPSSVFHDKIDTLFHAHLS